MPTIYTGLLAIRSNDPSTPREIDLRFGIWLPASLQVLAGEQDLTNGGTLDFGSMQDDETADREIELHNVGELPMTVDEINVTGSAYSVIGFSPETVLPGEFMTATLRVTPDGSVGTITGAVSVVATGTTGASFDLTAESTLSPLLTGVPNGQVNDIGFFADGSSVIVGQFNAIGATVRSKIAYLNPDGSLKTTDSIKSLNEGVYGVLVMDDDPITGWFVVCGFFTEMGGATRTGMAAINADGTLRTSFADPNFTFGGGFPRRMLKTTDNKIMVVGNFAAVNGVPNTGRIAVINTDGSRDAGFVGYADFEIFDVAYQSAGKLIVVGDHSTYRGVAAKKIIRINSDGTLDATFDSAYTPATGPGTVAITPTSRVVIGASAGGAKVLQLLPDGASDPSFTPTLTVAANFPTYGVAIGPNGDLVVGGYWGPPDEGQCVGGFCAVTSTGQSIPGWGGGPGVAGIGGAGAGNGVDRVVVRGEIAFIVGQFVTVHGQTRVRIAKVHVATGAVAPNS